jgi:hypothetical protein
MTSSNRHKKCRDKIDKKFLEIREEQYEIWRKETFLRFYKKLDIDINKFHKYLKKMNFKKLYDKGYLEKIYKINQSITQSLRSCTGKEFENMIRQILDENHISYSYQVYIDENGKVVGHKKDSAHIVDFVIPKCKIGKSLKKFTILSCKTTLRERFLQDFGIKCYRKFIITLDEKTSQAKKCGFECFVINSKKNNLTSLINKLQEESLT